MSSERELVLQSLATVGFLTRELDPPDVSFPTPPWMAKRFALKLVECVSLDEVCLLVSEHLRDAIAFVMLCTAWLDHAEVQAWNWKRPASARHPELTSAGYFALDVLKAMEASYPEGLTEIPE